MIDEKLIEELAKTALAFPEGSPGRMSCKEAAYELERLIAIEKKAYIWRRELRRTNKACAMWKRICDKYIKGHSHLAQRPTPPWEEMP